MFRFVSSLMILCSMWSINGHMNNLVWNGGPLHVECEHGADLWIKSGEHLPENVIAIKAVAYKDDIYVITPRLKRGVLATLWLIVHRRQRSDRIELQPFPELRTHSIGTCQSLQNAIDIHLDHLGNLWILDSGIIETTEQPRCTCPAKVMMISVILGKVTKRVDLSSLAVSTSLLQNVAVEYGIGGKAFIYVSDASRGTILVHEVASGSQWSVVVCSPAHGMQMVLVRRSPGHTVMIVNRLHHPGLFELDTAVLRRKNSLATLTVFGEHTKPVVLLGSHNHHVYLRHVECSDVLSWDTRHPYNGSRLLDIHSAGPRLTPTSVATNPLKHVLLVLDSNYGDAVHLNVPTHHRITFIGQI